MTAGLKASQTDGSCGLLANLAFEVAVLIVGYRNPQDIVDCLLALSRATASPAFDIFICENGGHDAYNRLVGALIGKGGPCVRGQSPGTGIDCDTNRFTDVQHLALRARLVECVGCVRPRQPGLCRRD
ncbi:hypothetical protein ACVW0I_005982 [Bradyrhizobium sp. LM6.11]